MPISSGSNRARPHARVREPDRRPARRAHPNRRVRRARVRPRDRDTAAAVASHGQPAGPTEVAPTRGRVGPGARACGRGAGPGAVTGRAPGARGSGTARRSRPRRRAAKRPHGHLPRDPRPALELAARDDVPDRKADLRTAHAVGAQHALPQPRDADGHRLEASRSWRSAPARRSGSTATCPRSRPSSSPPRNRTTPA